MIENFLVGTASGFIASLVFIYYQFRFLRPQVQISEFISKEQGSKGPEYGFKFINRTPYPIIDVKFVLEVVRMERVQGGPIGVVKKLKEGAVFQIDQYASNDKDAQYAHRVSYKEPLEEQWPEGSVLRIRVLAKHSLSGYSSVFSKVYDLKRTAIRDGAHEWGSSLNVT